MIMILWFNDSGNCLFLFLLLSRIASSYEMMRCEGSDLKNQHTCRKNKRVYIKILIVRLSLSLSLKLKFMANFFSLTTAAARSICYLYWPRLSPSFEIVKKKGNFRINTIKQPMIIKKKREKNVKKPLTTFFAVISKSK